MRIYYRKSKTLLFHIWDVHDINSQWRMSQFKDSRWIYPAAVLFLPQLWQSLTKDDRKSFSLPIKKFIQFFKILLSRIYTLMMKLLLWCLQNGFDATKITHIKDKEYFTVYYILTWWMIIRMDCCAPRHCALSQKGLNRSTCLFKP